MKNRPGFIEVERKVERKRDKQGEEIKRDQGLIVIHCCVLFCYACVANTERKKGIIIMAFEICLEGGRLLLQIS